MYYKYLVTLIIASIIGYGIYLLLPLNKNEENDGFFDNYIKKVNKSFNKSIIKVKSNNLFAGTSIYFDRRVYETMRHLLLIIMLSIGVITFKNSFIIVGLILYFLMISREKIAGKKTPFAIVKDMVLKADRTKKDEELVECLSLLKNIIVQQKDNPMNAEYMIKFISQSMHFTKPAFLQLISKMRLNRLKEAEEIFYKEIGTDLSKELGHLLVQLDELDPIELEEIIISRQAFVREYRKTQEIKKAELTSDLIYIPIIIDATIILFNFLIVTYYIPQSDAIANFF